MAGGSCKRPDRARVPGWPLNCDVAALSIKHRPNRNFFAQPTKIFTAALDTEPPRPRWPETNGQAQSLARDTGPSLQGAGGHGRIAAAARGFPVHSVSRRRQPSPSVQDRRAISVPLTPVKTGISRSLADSQLRSSGHVKAPEGPDSQADSAGSIPGDDVPGVEHGREPRWEPHRRTTS